MLDTDHVSLILSNHAQVTAIAAIALSLNLPIATRNRRNFELVPNLQIIDWTI